MATLVRRRLKQKTTLADDRARTAAAVTAAAASAVAAAAHAASTEALAAAQNHADGVRRRLRDYANELRSSRAAANRPYRDLLLERVANYVKTNF